MGASKSTLNIADDRSNSSFDGVKVPYTKNKNQEDDSDYDDEEDPSHHSMISEIPGRVDPKSDLHGDGSQFFRDINQDRSDVKLITDTQEVGRKKLVDDDSVIQMDKASNIASDLSPKGSVRAGAQFEIKKGLVDDERKKESRDILNAKEPLSIMDPQ